MQRSLLPLCLLAFFLVGCASPGQKPSSQVKKKRSYKKGYKSIKDRLREEAILRYARLRLKSLQNKWSEKPPRRKGKRTKKLKVTTYGIPKAKPKSIVRRLPKKAPTPKPRAKLLANPEELKIEIDQNLAYYCMARRKQYKNQSSCQQVTKNALQSCEGKFDPDDRGLLKCVKSQLKF